MAHIISKNFSVFSAEQFIKSFDDAENIYYMFYGNHLTDIDNQDEIDDSVSNIVYNTFNNMIAAKHIRSQDTKLMVPRYDWSSGTVYDQYDDQENHLFEKKFYVVTNENNNYHVFKCLSNNNKSKSISAPQYSQISLTDQIYETSDGYQWKFLYTINQNDWKQFATSDFIPVIINEDVKAAAINGAISKIEIQSPGHNYNAYANGSIENFNNREIDLSGVLSSNNNFYKDSLFYVSSGTGAGQYAVIESYNVGDSKTITIDRDLSTPLSNDSRFSINPQVTIKGDGDGALARAIVNSENNANNILEVQIVNQGSGYTCADVQISSNTGIYDTSSQSYVQNSADTRAIISPPGGHGYDVPNELYATRICVSTTFANTGTTDHGRHAIAAVNDFRQIGIIKSPLLETGFLTINTDNSSMLPQPGEIITGTTSKATAKVVEISSNKVIITDILGIFNHVEHITGSINADFNITNRNQRTNYIDQTLKYIGTDHTGDFALDEELTQDDNDAKAFIESIEENYVSDGQQLGFTLRVTNYKNRFLLSDSVNNIDKYINGKTSGATLKVNSIKLPDFKVNTGDILYIDNFEPITRHWEQSETFKVIISF